jgi:hypothetical protein
LPAFPPLDPGQAGRHAVLAEDPIHPKGTGARVSQFITGSLKLHAILVSPDYPGRDDPVVLGEDAHQPIQMVFLATLEIPLSRQLDQPAAG